MSKRWGLLAITLAILAATIIFYWLDPDGGFILERNIVYVAAPVLALLTGLWVLSVTGWSGPQACVLTFLVIGVACWTTGEVLWVYYEFIAHIDPFPSVADYFYIGAYPAIFVGLLGEYQLSRSRIRKLDPVIGFLLGIIACLAILLIVYFGIILPYDPMSPMIENVIAIDYSVGDMIIVFSALMVLILAWEFKGGMYMKFFLFLFLALVCVLLADLGFAMYTDEYVAGSWWYKNSFDTLWISSYLFWALAFGNLAISLSNTQEQLAKKMAEGR